MMTRAPLKATFGIVALLIAGAALGEDWPQWQGADRSGVSRESGLMKAWPAGGPKLTWRASGLGEGYSAPSIANGRVFGMGLRGNEEDVWALDEKTGNGIWRVRMAAGASLAGTQGGNGPRATPTVEGNRVYALGASGDLVCLSAADGSLRWRKSLVNDFGGAVPTWGYSESPLVDGDRVIVAPGGRSTVVALNTRDGSVLWQCAVPERDSAHYTSAIVADVGGQRQ
jgi:outer membrane protein assembly factor BamB